MSDRKKGQELQKNTGFCIVCGGASLFLAVVLAVSTVRQLQGGLVFSGLISGLGTALFALVAGILIAGLIKAARAKRKK